MSEAFTIILNHKNLTYFMSSKKLTEKQVKWAEKLTDFDFKLEFRAKHLNVRADALSRREQDVPQRD